jgi:hypothetical protein
MKALFGRGSRLAGAARGEFAWALPVLLIWLVYFSPKHILSPETAITGLGALGLFALAVRRPDRSLLALAVIFPFQGLILSWLWAAGLPASVDKHLGAWKETLALAVVAAGARAFIASGRRADTLDRLALGFVALVAAYAAFQSKLLPSAPSVTSIRLLGFRETAGFVLVLLGARHAPLGPDFRRRALRALLAVATVVSAIGVYEEIDPNGWNQFVVNTIKYTQYQAFVLGSPVADPKSILNYSTDAGVQIERIGSVFLETSFLAWYLILPFAIGLERVIRRTASPLIVGSTGLIAVAEILTQTRSAILGCVLVVFLGLLPAAGRKLHWRTQASLLAVGLVLLAIPLALSTGLVTRVDQTTNSNDVSTSGHLSGFTQGIDTMKAHPFGLGIGTAAGTGQRFGVQGYVIPEDNYLEVGDEVGIAGGLLFLALTVVLLVGLRRAARRAPDPLVAATWSGGVGLAVAAIFLQTWSNFAVAWTFWGLAGVTLAATRAQRRPVATAEPAIPSERLLAASQPVTTHAPAAIR